MADKKITIGLRIKRRREELGLSQGELGKKLDTSGPTVGRWEIGGAIPRGSRRLQLAKALDTTTAALFSEEREVQQAPALDHLRAELEERFANIERRLSQSKDHPPMPGVDGNYFHDLDPPLAEVVTVLKGVDVDHWNLLMSAVGQISALDKNELATVIELLKRFKGVDSKDAKAHVVNTEAKTRRKA